jgi:betaine-aldehyde dehydrogenase
MSAVIRKEVVTETGPRLAAAKHWIGGEWVDSEHHGDSFNPATGEIIGRYARGSAAEAQRAIDEAKRAFREEDWAKNRTLRAQVLNAMADRFEARAEELARLTTIENGKALAHARFEIGIVPLTLRFNAALALTDYGRSSEVETGGLSLVIREPVGVAGIIAPWNSPATLMIRSLAPALRAEHTSLRIRSLCLPNKEP